MQKPPHYDVVSVCPLCQGVRRPREGSYCWDCKRAIDELQNFTRKQLADIIRKGVVNLLRAKAALQ